MAMHCKDRETRVRCPAALMQCSICNVIFNRPSSGTMAHHSSVGRASDCSMKCRYQSVLGSIPSGERPTSMTRKIFDL